MKLETVAFQDKSSGDSLFSCRQWIKEELFFVVVERNLRT